MKAGDKVGILGFGGLGDMVVKLTEAIGAEVTMFTRHEDKLGEIAALDTTGVLEGDAQPLETLKSNFDSVLPCIPEEHDINP